MFLLMLAVYGDHSAKDLHITGGEACVSCTMFTKMGLKVRVLCRRSWMSMFQRPTVDHKHKHPTVNFEKCGCFSRSQRTSLLKQRTSAIICIFWWSRYLLQVLS